MSDTDKVKSLPEGTTGAGPCSGRLVTAWFVGAVLSGRLTAVPIHHRSLLAATVRSWEGDRDDTDCTYHTADRNVRHPFTIQPSRRGVVLFLRSS